MCLALPAQVVELAENDMAKVSLGGVTKDVNVALIEDLTIGDYIIIHVGFALSKISEDEAQKTLALFEELGQLDQALQEFSQ